jgi:hypothetical protein
LIAAWAVLPYARIGAGKWLASGLAIFAAWCVIAAGASAIAQTTSGGAPLATTVVPEGTPPPAPVKSKPKHHASAAADNEVEPGHAKVKLTEDTWVFSRPNKWSRTVERVHRDKFINVTGSTHYYLRVQLKDGRVGYISPSSVELVAPVDKIFTLTMDTPVHDQPNRWGKKVAEVHRGRQVHVIGMALEYMQIRMKDGLEGFIPATALE